MPPTSRVAADAIHAHLPSRSNGIVVVTASAPSSVAFAPNSAPKRTVSRPSESIASRAPPRSVAVTRTRVPRGTRNGGAASRFSFARCKYAGYCANNNTSPIHPRSATVIVASATGARPSLRRKEIGARTGPSASVATPFSLCTAILVSRHASPDDRRDTVITRRPSADKRIVSGMPRGTDVGTRSNANAGNSKPRHARSGCRIAEKPSVDTRAASVATITPIIAHAAAIARARTSFCASRGTNTAGTNRRATSCAARAPSTPLRPTSNAPRNEPARSRCSVSIAAAIDVIDSAAVSRRTKNSAPVAAAISATAHNAKGNGAHKVIQRPASNMNVPTAAQTASTASANSTTVTPAFVRSTACSRAKRASSVSDVALSTIAPRSDGAVTVAPDSSPHT